MIAKISSTDNLGGALGYNFKKVEKEEASILLTQGLYQNKEGTYTMAEVFADMQAVIPEKCRTKKMVFHCSLNCTFQIEVQQTATFFMVPNL